MGPAVFLQLLIKRWDSRQKREHGHWWESSMESVPITVMGIPLGWSMGARREGTGDRAGKIDWGSQCRASRMTSKGPTSSRWWLRVTGAGAT